MAAQGESAAPDLPWQHWVRRDRFVTTGFPIHLGKNTSAGGSDSYAFDGRDSHA